jgi:hypothetical protein
MMNSGDPSKVFSLKMAEFSGMVAAAKIEMLVFCLDKVIDNLEAGIKRSTLKVLRDAVYALGDIHCGGFELARSSDISIESVRFATNAANGVIEAAIGALAGASAPFDIPDHVGKTKKDEAMAFIESEMVPLMRAHPGAVMQAIHNTAEVAREAGINASEIINPIMAKAIEVFRESGVADVVNELNGNIVIAINADDMDQRMPRGGFAFPTDKNLN